jgi:predicted phosphate transport protein (TIGR00153 family)
MRLERILHVLMPKDTQFYDYFEKDVDNLRAASRLFREMMSNDISKEERAQKIRKIEELEHRGDEVTHQIFSSLGATFITPFDREDIHLLASKLDDILDYLQGAANRIVLYKGATITTERAQLAGMIDDAVTELHQAITHLRNFRDIEEMKTCLVKINSYENQADDLFERAIARLFEECKDPILLIKQKELLVSLETATDQCEDAANVIESIIVKNA